ncbi:unnamed protein product [Brachionus calyciflorus]|uniref:Uncharacterized protein n=1 Tax=Brachionus calyciflorus TaxID=104777 RepID=A0A814JMW1_9BILA|nr:unnamed protein product [Brachionus calyciflorus]
MSLSKKFRCCGTTTSEEENKVLQAVLNGERMKNILEDTEGEQELHAFIDTDLTDDEDDYNSFKSEDDLSDASDSSHYEDQANQFDDHNSDETDGDDEEVDEEQVDVGNDHVN